MTRLLICAPLGIEARAVRRGTTDARVLGTGYGPGRSARSATALSVARFDAFAVAGVCGAVAPGLRPGDVLVATEVRADEETHRCPSAEPLAGALARDGLTVHTGPLVTTDHLVRGAERTALADSGVLGVDMESAPLLVAASDAPTAVVRVVVDTPDRPLARLGTVTGGLAALRTLRRIGPALERWAAAAGPRRVVLAAPRSFCAGVDRAIEVVERAIERYGTPVYVRKQIVHNAHVVRDLENRGAIFVDELDAVPDRALTVFSAHGVAPAVRAEADRRGLRVIDATCPLVAKVHTEARRFAGRGDQVAFIGHAGHEETEGTLGEAPESTVLVSSAEDVATLDPNRRVAFLMQTTLAADEAGDVASAIRERFPDADGPSTDDICYATTNRQNAVRAIADEADLMLVVGSANSSNSRRLVEVAERAGTPARLIDDARGIALDELANARVVGLTAGASAPPPLVESVVDTLRGLGPVEVAERRVTEETVQFTLPKEVRS